jgi:hypothetical protein
MASGYCVGSGSLRRRRIAYWGICEHGATAAIVDYAHEAVTAIGPDFEA